MPRRLLILAALLVASCGGGGGGGGSTSSSGPVLSSAPPVPGAGMRVEESDAAVTLSGAWTRSDAKLGWSGGSALQSGSAGATATITFNGTAIRWIDPTASTGSSLVVGWSSS